MMKRRRLTSSERAWLKYSSGSALMIRNDYARRLRNALLCLAACDPQWMIFIEREVPRRVAVGERRRVLQLVESRARWRVLRNYNYFQREKITEMIFRHDWYFTDEGSLGSG